MPRMPFALILKVSDIYLPSVRLLINGITSQRAAFLPAPWDDDGGQARHRTVIQPGQCFAVGGCVRAAGKVLPVAQSPHPVEFRDAAEPIQGDKATSQLALKIGHGSPFGFLGCATMPAPSITPGRVIWPWTITATFSAPNSAMVARALR
jgi:hypothetical protein